MYRNMSEREHIYYVGQSPAFKLTERKVYF